MPALRGQTATPGRFTALVTELPEGWVRVTCPEGGDWSTARPAHAARSCAQAHRLHHLKAMTSCTLPPPPDQLSVARYAQQIRASLKPRPTR